MWLIVANYGNNSLALIEWARQKKLTEVTVVTVDTGWAAASWPERVAAGERYAQQAGFKTVQLVSKLSFAQLVRERGEFPTAKFQWCAGILKGLPILTWLDEIDPYNQASILIGTNYVQRREEQLSEVVDESEYYGGRSVHYPLINLTRQQRDQLILEAGFPVLAHRSLECDPCINSQPQDFQRILHSPNEIEKTVRLEKDIQQAMFGSAAHGDFRKFCVEQAACASEEADAFQRGCGSPYACGD